MAEEVTATAAAEKAPFVIFGSADLTDKGQVKSTYPSWYFDHLKEELRNDIDRTEHQLEMDKIPRSEVPLTRERLQQKKAKLKELDQAAVELRGKNKDRAAKIYGELGEEISNRLFTRDDMRKGLANAHEEVKRMTEPCIEVKGDTLNFLKACNVKVIKGKVTREGAAKGWKILGKALQDNTNVEHLRRESR